MAFPNPPDFTSGEPLAAHWAVLLSGNRLQRMASQGETVIKRIQRSLNELGIQALPSAGALRAGPIAVDGVWGYQTMAGLRNLALQMNMAQPGEGWQTVADRLNADIAARRIDLLALRMGLWAAYVRTNSDTRNQGWETVSVPANARLPVWGQGADDDRNAGGPELSAVAWLEGVQTPPVPPQRASSSNAAPLGSGQGAGAPATAPGARGVALAPPTAATPTKSAELGFFERSTWGVDNKILTGGAVAAAALIWSQMKKPRRGRRRRAPRQIGAST